MIRKVGTLLLNHDSESVLSLVSLHRQIQMTMDSLTKSYFKMARIRGCPLPSLAAGLEVCNRRFRPRVASFDPLQKCAGRAPTSDSIDTAVARSRLFHAWREGVKPAGQCELACLACARSARHRPPRRPACRDQARPSRANRLTPRSTLHYLNQF